MGGVAAAQPTANFSATPVTGCPPMVVSFTDLSTGGAITWSWSFSGGTPSTAFVKNPIISYLTPGTYSVTLTVSNGTTSSAPYTKTGYITVKTPPSVSFTASPLAACAKVPISFTSSITWNAPGSGTYHWDFGDGGTASSANPTYNYANGGTYTVKLTATNSSGCPTTDTQVNYVTVYSPPSVGFYATDTAVCSLGGSTTFISTTSGSSPFSYVWDFGDGSGLSSATPPVSHSYASAGKYTVKAVVTDSKGCTDSLKLNNYINVHTVSAAASVPASACVGAAVNTQAVAPTTGGAALSWDFGDGYTATGPAAGHTYLTAGTYTIRFIATVGGCSDTDKHTITISPKPSAAFTYSPSPACPAPSLISFTNTSSGSFVSSLWDFGDGSPFSTVTSPLHTYALGGQTYTVKLTVTNAAGCTSTAQQSFDVYNTVFYISAQPPSGCAPVTIAFKDSLFVTTPLGSMPYPSPRVSWSWNFGTGSATSTSATPSFTYSNTGTYYATVATTTANGCVFHDTFKVRTGSHATPNFYTLTPNPCNRTQIQFLDSSVSPFGSITNWNYDFGDGGNSFGPANPYYTYTVPGIYTVTLVTDQNGCFDTVKKQNYIHVGLPGSKFVFKVNCNKLGEVQFTDSSAGATSMLWRFGDGTTSTQTNPVHQYSVVPGVYTVSQITYNSLTGCKDSLPHTVIINNYSTNMSALDSNVCVGDTVFLSPVISGSAAPLASTLQSVAWSYTPMPGLFNDPLTMANGVYEARARGRYNITVLVKDLNDCPATRTNNNFITVGGPIVHFKATPTTGCAPATIVLTDTTNYVPSTYPIQYIWDYGDGTNATINGPLGPSVTHFYPNVGGYAIKLIVRDNIGCVDSFGAPNYITITRPTAIFSSTISNACVGSPFQFFSSSTGTGITHKWDFGDGTTSTMPSPSHVYVTPGTYSIRLIVTDYAGCKDTMYKASAVNVTVSPHASFTMDDTLNVCPPMFVNFTSTSTGAASYAWSFGNGTGSTLTNPSVTYTSPGYYPIRLIARNALGCPDTAYGHARVLGYPGAVLSYGPPLFGCAPFTVNFRANNVDGVPGFIYNFGDGTTAATTATVMTHTYTQPGPHLPSITMTDNLGCSAVSVGIDTIKVDGVFAGFTFSPFPACDKGTIQFQDTSRGAYTPLNPPRWAFHDGTTSNLAAPSKTYSLPGTYPVVLYSSTTGGCKDTFRSNVIFYPLPKIIAADDTTICITDSAILRARGGVSYVWSPAASLSCANCNTPYASPTVPTTYVVTGMDAHGCTSTDTLVVRLRYKTVTDVKPASAEICSGDTLTLTATPGYTSYHWSPATGLLNKDTSSTPAYPGTSQQYVLISKVAGCAADTDMVNIIVHPTPTVKAASGQSIIAGTPVRLEATATGIITKWLWSPSDGLFTPTSPATDAHPKASTTYTVTATTEFGCYDSDTLRIIVTCDNKQVYLPNTFTPDGNGVNDVFYPRGRGLSNINRFRIYNRWGEVVFDRSNIAVDDKSNGWDGRKGGTLLPPDVYVYTIDALCDTGEPLQWQGDVMLLR